MSATEPIPGQEVFDFDLPEPKYRSKKRERITDRPVYKSSHAIGTVAKPRPKCDACVRAMIGGSKMVAPDPVVYERITEGSRTYLCYRHTQAARAEDGMALLKRRH